MVLVKKVYLPRDRYDTNQLHSIIPIFKKLKSIVYLSARTSKNVPDTTARIPEHMVIMHTPIVLTRTKRLRLDPIP
jgi:hypothetical protein